MINLISEKALRADDSNFNDLTKNHYKKALLKAQRKVAKRYNLVQRLYTAGIKSIYGKDYDSPNDTEDIKLPMTNFISEYEVTINERAYKKVDRLTAQSEREYVLERNHNEILFNYWIRSKNDSLKIYFTSDINEEDFDVETEAPIIPSQYNEELMALALADIAKYGIIKYSGSDKESKFVNLSRMYGFNEKNLDKELLKNDTWVNMEVYRAY